MAVDTKVTDFPELAEAPALDDWVYLVDRSDLADDPAGSSKKLLVSNLALISPAWLEFTAQAANPGAVAANTLYQDDGSNFIAGSMVWGDLSNPAVFGADFSVGPVGTEQGGINVGGVNYDATMKLNSVGGSLDSQLILHRHSTSFPPIVTFARTNDDTVGHTAVVAGQTLGSLIYTGWSGTHYDIAGVIDVRVPTGATVSPTSLAAEMAFFTTPDGSNTAALAMLIGSDQTIYGDTTVGGTLRLQGSTDAALGEIELVAPVELDWDFTVSGSVGGITWANVIPASGGAVVGMIRNTSNITVNNPTFISATIYDTSVVEHVVNPGFAVATLFLAQPVYKSTTAAVNPVQAFTLAAQPQFESDGAGARTVTSFYAVSVAGSLRATTSGDGMTVTNYSGMVVAPIFSSVSGSTINFGNIRAVWARNPAKGLFAPGAGVETIASYAGLFQDNVTFNTGNPLRAAVRSNMVAGTNKYFLYNGSTAVSYFGTGHIYFADNGSVVFGGVGVTTFDVIMNWQAAGYLRVFFGANNDDLRLSNPSNDTFLFDSNAGNTTGEYLFNCKRFAFGQSGAVGNQIGVFAAPADTPQVGGGYAQYLLTQSGSYTNGGFAMGDVSAWVINAMSFASSSGSVSELATLRVGGMTTSNVGVTVTERAALWVRGRHMQEGSVQFEPIDPAALNSGNNNNWAGLLTGSPSNNTRYWARISGNATTSIITGIDATAVQDGDTFELTNVSANAISITDQDAASTAANRLITPTGVTYVLGADESVIIRYDATTARWRLLAGTGA